MKFILGIFLSPKTRFAIKIVAASWILSLVLLINGYIGLLASILTVSKLEPTINTLDELAASQRFRLTIEKNSILVNQIMVYFVYLFRKLSIMQHSL